MWLETGVFRGFGLARLSIHASCVSGSALGGLPSPELVLRKGEKTVLPIAERLCVLIVPLGGSS